MLLGALLLFCLGCQPPTSSSLKSEAAGALWNESASLTEQAEIILRLQNGIERARLFATLLGSAEPEDVDWIPEALERSPRERGDVELALFGEWWASFDPVAAYEWSRSHWLSESPRVLTAVIRTWARQDPQAANEFTLEYSRPFAGGANILRSEVIEAILVGWVESGEPGSLDVALEIKDLSTRRGALRALGRIRVTTQGAAQALSWALGAEVAEESQRVALLRSVMSAAADQEPRVAAEFAASLEASGQDYRRMYPRIGQRWARWEPIAAMDWVEQLEEGDQRDQTVKSITEMWLRRNPETARTWFEAQDSPQQWLEPAIGEYVDRLLRDAAPDANWQAMLERWTLPLTQDQSRWDLNVKVLSRWIVHDEDASTAWLEAHPDVLPARHRRHLKSLVETQREKYLRQSARNAEKRRAS